MISDNASTYLAAADELHQLFDSLSLKQALEYHGVTWCNMAIYTQESSLVWGLLGETDWFNETGSQEDIGENLCHLTGPRGYCG